MAAPSLSPKAQRMRQYRHAVMVLALQRAKRGQCRPTSEPRGSRSSFCSSSCRIGDNPPLPPPWTELNKCNALKKQSRQAAALPSSPYVSHGPRKVVESSADLKSIPFLTRLFCGRQATMTARRFPALVCRGIGRLISAENGPVTGLGQP